ncbi:MAG: YajQ family cyclic di-GMP-binding protein [Myxococcaceae bacterium]
MPSFDIVSEIDQHEVQNAFDQTERELAQRFDFRGTNVKIERTDKGFLITANSEDRVKAAHEVLVDKFAKRKLSLKFLDKKEALPAGGQSWRLEIDLKKGIDKDNSKKLVQLIKDDKTLKVTPSIQGESVRVTGKKKDDLQEVMSILRNKDFPVELSFNNFRD